MFRSMSAGAVAAEDLAAARAFVERTLAEHPDRALSVEALIEVLRDVERVEGGVLDGMAVELGRRLARLHGLPAPHFSDDFHPDFSAVSDRALAALVLGQAAQLSADAAPKPSCEALFLILGVARLLAMDPLIVPPTEPRCAEYHALRRQ
jgi:hypothetical protein